MFIRELKPTDRQYAVVVIGSGFGSMFFVHRLLEHQPETRILILERGPLRSWETQLKEQRNSAMPPAKTYRATGISKPWNFTIGYGGGTNCWGATTPRMHPNDFLLKSLYGRGQDWPITYDTLEPYYCQAEDVMDISGPDDISIITPRSQPYPQPPHKFSAVDKVMKQAQPELHFGLPSARARRANKQRPQCCASNNCYLCPVGAKFTALNGFQHIADHPKVDILLEAEALEVERSDGSRISAVRFRHNGKDLRVGCDLCVLGANAIHSPAILLRSGFEHPLLGCGLNEQLTFAFEVLLDGLDNFDGSTISTGTNYSLYDGAFRSDSGAAFLVFDNWYPMGLRKDFGRWRQTLSLRGSVEDELLNENRVTVDRNGEVVVHFERRSPYAHLGVKRVVEQIAAVVSPLPVERLDFKGTRHTASHLHGTMRMGTDHSNSLVDHAQRYHDVSNLIVVGTSVLPTCPPVQPSLTAAALSLRAADLAFGDRHDAT